MIFEQLVFLPRLPVKHDAVMNIVDPIQMLRKVRMPELDDLASLGMNMLMLYTEDTFEMPKYPFFGHKRGRYTIAELKEIDD